MGTTIYPQTLGGSNMTKSYVLKFDINSPASFIWRINDFDTLSLNNFFTGIIEKPNGDFILGGVIEREHKKNLPDNCLNRLTWITPTGVVKNNRTYQYSNNTNADYVQLAQTITHGSNGSILAALQLYNTSPNPFFMVRYDSTGCDSSAFYCQTLGIGTYESLSYSVNIYPNPTESILYLKPQTTICNIAILIYNASGEKVIEKKINCIGPNIPVEILLKNLNNGIYFVQIFSDGALIKKEKILKE